MKASTHKGRCRVALLVLAALAAATLSACSPQTSPTPPASKPGTVPTSSVGAQTPSSTASTPTTSSAHQGTVAPDTYRAIVDSLKREGFAFRDEAGLLMRYGDDRGRVTVSGTMTRQENGGSKGYSVVEMELQNKQWTVVSAR